MFTADDGSRLVGDYARLLLDGGLTLQVSRPYDEAKDDDSRAMVAMSPARMLYGQNVGPVTHAGFRRAMSIAKERLRTVGADVPLSKATISRMELKCDLRFPHDILSVLSHVQVPRMQRRDYPEGVIWFNKQVSVSVYKKHAELKSKGQRHSMVPQDLCRIEIRAKTPAAVRRLLGTANTVAALSANFDNLGERYSLAVMKLLTPALKKTRVKRKKTTARMAIEAHVRRWHAAKIKQAVGYSADFFEAALERRGIAGLRDAARQARLSRSAVSRFVERIESVVNADAWTPAAVQEFEGFLRMIGAARVACDVPDRVPAVPPTFDSWWMPVAEWCLFAGPLGRGGVAPTVSIHALTQEWLFP